MKNLSWIVLSLILFQSATAFPCTTECPGGYLEVCVKHRGECYCSCAQDASEGARALGSLLREAGVSRRKIDKAVRQYQDLLDDGEPHFSFEIRDDGETIRIFVSTAGEELNETITITESK